MNTLDAVVKFMALDSLLCWNLQLHVRAEKHDSEFQPSNLLYSLFKGGKFDIIQLIGALNDEFDISIPATEIIPANFNSVDAMCAMVEKLADE